MKNVGRLFEILDLCTVQLRKGEMVTTSKDGPIEVTEINAMPHVHTVGPDLEKIDVCLLVIGVDRGEALKHKGEVIEILKTSETDLHIGPSYMTVGAEIGDQGFAFQLFGLGEVLDLWKVLTPAALGVTDEQEARKMAQNGFVMISGFKTDQTITEEVAPRA